MLFWRWCCLVELADFQVLEFLKGRMQKLGMQVDTDSVEIFMAYCRGVTRKQNPSCSVPTWIQLCRAVFMMECWG